ncbi:MAG: PH domain-containing protein [Actinobacteria bacterium]|jgi:uncharacterized membrane protein YdbT with pleckstrin-like domain|uniref:Unannotated protein n=1 Tax=freshwater metagenome TaxID=449393 RepID=A0A6J6XYN5_9ZZZZ|nr:PH domain-containing protein [Actinomycetota bacterium]
MAYPKKHLNPNETVVLDLQPHWWFFAGSASTLALCVIAGLVVTGQLEPSTGRKFLMYVITAAIVLSAVWLLQRFVKWRTTNFVITSDRVIFREGMIAKRGVEIPLGRVNNINFNQTIFERIIGAGDLLIESGGEDGQQRFTDISHPQSVQNLLHAQVEAKAARTSGFTPPSPVPFDIASQLEKLEGLLDRGALSQDEFDAQKARLLRD